MIGLESLVHAARRRARAKRASLFRRSFAVEAQTRILDIGSEDGQAIAAVLEGTAARAENVYLADIDEALVRRGSERFGFVPVPVGESGKLPFADGFFDIVYCSSVIEHVTVPKADVWSHCSGASFRALAQARQREFADEIRRLGRTYFVQTPNKWFPLESHTWLPFVGFLPRRLQVDIISLSNGCWIKRTTPDWCLLTAHDMQGLFPDADIHAERFCGLTKSIMAIRT